MIMQRWQVVLWIVEAQRHETLELVAETAGQAQAIVSRPGVEVRAVTRMYAVSPFPQELLSTSEAMAYTSWSRHTLWRRHNAGELTAIKDSHGRLSWKKSELDAARAGKAPRQADLEQRRAA